MNTAKPVSEILPKTLEMLEPTHQLSQSPKPSESSYVGKMLSASEGWKNNWIKARFDLKVHHPDLKKLEDSLWTFCLGFACCPVRGSRLVIHGPNGIGKSRVCRRLARWIQDRKMELPLVDSEVGMRTVTCVHCNWPERVDQFKEGIWEIENLLDCSLLLLDDLGAEHDPSKVGLEKLYLILDRREWRWTVITTNSAPDNWEAQFERRIADRLLRNSTVVDLSNVPSFATI